MKKRRAREEPAAWMYRRLLLLEVAGILLAVGARSSVIGLDQRQGTQLDDRRFGVRFHDYLRKIQAQITPFQ